MKGTPQPIIYRGLHYPSQTALALAYGRDPRIINERIHGNILDERLVAYRRIYRKPTVTPPSAQWSPMYVRTYFGEYKV